MRHIAVGVAMFLIACAALMAQDTSGAKEGSRSLDKDKEQVLAAIRGRLDALAKRDFAAWASFVSDKMIAPLGGTKQGLLNERRSWPEEVRYFYGPLEDIRIQLFGDTAVVAYRSKQLNEIGGQTTYQNKWQIETHIRQGKKWLLVAIGDAVIPPEPTAVNIDSRIYDAYVGRYEWSPTLISTITRDGDRLIEEFGKMGKSELLPESETTFFVKGEAAGGDSSRVIFVKDSAGRVTHYIYRELGGTDRIVKRIR
jgi:uncharacterized protein DUF3471